MAVMTPDLSLAVCCVVVYVASSVANSLEAIWQGQLGEDDLAAFGMRESSAGYASALDFMWLGVLARISREADQRSRACTLRMGWIASLCVGLPLV